MPATVKRARTHVRAAAVILAAGLGTRFGGSKMLADIEGKAMLQHVLDAVADAELSPVVVVLGRDADRLEQSLAWRAQARISNPDPERGLSSSLALGLAALDDAERALIVLGDQPFISVAQLRAIARAMRDPRRPIVVPRYGGKPGNPVLLEIEAWPLAATLSGDRGMSQLFASTPDLVRYVDVPGSNPDFDTPEDISALSRA